MSEFNEIYGEKFFIIDSNNLDVISSNFYGFSIKDNAIIQNHNFNDENDLSGLGSYIYVNSDGDDISIYQDLTGSWGLYIYKERDYFALSNSFFKLVEHVNEHKLSLNKEYSNTLMSLDECNFIYRQTLVNEIDTIPRNVIVNINKHNAYISFKKMDYKMHYIPLNSKDALTVLDNWFYRWINLFRLLKNKTNNIEFNIDGSFNSRIILLLMICSNIDLNKINFSICDELFNSVSSKDYEIVSEIAKKYNFNPSNNSINVKKTSFDDIKTIINLPFYIEGGFNNTLNYKFYKNDDLVYNFSPIASEMMCTDKFYYNKSFNQIFDDYINLSNNLGYFDKSSLEYVIHESLMEISKKFNIDSNSSELFDLSVYESKCRNHFGKFMVVEYLTNKLLLTPFLDPELHKLKLTTIDCDDKYLVYALIFVRYLPELLDFDFSSGFKFDVNTINIAKKINKIFPFSDNELDFVSGEDIVHIESNFDDKFDEQNINEYFLNIINLDSFENQFNKYFSEGLYVDLVDFCNNSNTSRLNNINPIMYRLYLIHCIKSNLNLSFDLWLENFYESNHNHKISSIDGLQEILDAKADISHTHDSFSKEQIKFLQKFFGGNIFSDVKFELVDNVITRDDSIKFKDIEVITSEGSDIDIDLNNLYIVCDDSALIPFTDAKYDKINKYYVLPAYYLNVGEHNICLKYDECYGQDILIFIKDEDNLFDGRVWLGSDYNKNLGGFDKFQVESISSSDDWSDIGKSSIKVVCDGSYNYQALVTPTQKVNVGDQINAKVTVYNNESKVTVRLFESSINDFVDVIVPASDNANHVTIDKVAKSDNMQLLIIARDKQTFYADNFVFTKKYIS